MPVDRITFDYSFDSPWLLTDDMVSKMNQAIEEGQSPTTVYANQMVEKLRNNPAFRDRYKAIFDAAEVDILSITLGTRVDPSIPLSESIWTDWGRWQAMFDCVPWLEKVCSPGEASVVAGEDKIGVVLNTQNLGGAIGSDLTRIEDLYNSGIRIFQPTYNRQNLLGTGCTDYSRGGLSAMGRRAVERINQLDAILDLSHCNYETTMDAIEQSSDPVAFTHTSCSAVAEHDRGKTDTELRALADCNGYVGIVAIPSFLAPSEPDPDFERFFDHIEHVASVVGTDRVGIGTDFMNIDTAFPEPLVEDVNEFASKSLFEDEHDAASGLGDGFGAFNSYTDWPIIKDGIHERFDPEDATGILGSNFLDFWRRVTQPSP